MGAEVGATTSTFPYTPHMRAYLHATARASVARAADEAAKTGYLRADEGVEYDEVIDIVRLPFLFHLLFVNGMGWDGVESVRVGTDYQRTIHT